MRLKNKLNIQNNEEGPMKVFIINQPVKNVIQGNIYELFLTFYNKF